MHCNILQSCPLREAPKRQEICLQSSRSYDQLCEIQFLAGIVNIKNEAGEALVTGSQHVRERSIRSLLSGPIFPLFSNKFPKIHLPCCFFPPDLDKTMVEPWKVINAPSFFVKIWSVVSLLIAPTTREKLGIGTVP